MILASDLLQALHLLDIREGLNMAILSGMIFGDRVITPYSQLSQVFWLCTNRLDYEKSHGLYEACGFFNHGGGGCDRFVETELEVLLKLVIVQLEVVAVSTIEQIVVTSVDVIPIGAIIYVSESRGGSLGSIGVKADVVAMTSSEDGAAIVLVWDCVWKNIPHWASCLATWNG